MNVIKNEIHIGIKEPFKLLHISDTHLTRTDANDTDERRAFAAERRSCLFKNTDENVEFIKKYVAATGYQLIQTGDLIDFITPENLRVARDFAKETKMLVVAGNHELHTCPNNIFSEDDFRVDLSHREQTLSDVQRWFDNDVRFWCEERSGVLLIGIDSSDYQIKPHHFEKLKRLSESGKPIILFTHIPLYTEELHERASHAMLAIPTEIVSTFSEYRIFEQTANGDTVAAVEFIKSCPQIKAVFSGHLHFDFESSEGTFKQFVTGLDTVREITVS